MTIRNRNNFIGIDPVESVDGVQDTISSLNERLSKFLNDHAISGDIINDLLQRQGVDRDSIYAEDGTIQLSEAEAEYILLYFRKDHPDYGNLNQEFANDIQNIELAEKLSDYISTNFEFKDDKVADILDLDIYDEDNNIKISPDQVANITGKQWLDFRTWTYDQKAERKAEEERKRFEEVFKEFEEVFGDEEIVQDKIKSECRKVHTLQLMDINLLNTKIINESLKSIEKKRKGKFRWQERNNFQRELGAVLDKLDQGYITAHQQSLISNIVTNLTSAADSSWFNNSITMNHKRIDQYLAKLIPDVTNKNEEFVIKHIKNEIVKHKVSDTTLVKRLSEFFNLTQDIQGNFGQHDPKNETTKYDWQQLADFRKHNPKIFDKILFPEEELTKIREKFKEEVQEYNILTQKGNLTKSSEAFATDILAKVVQGYEEKIELKEGEKIFSKLHGVLSNFDSQYLGNNKDKIIIEVTTWLDKHGEINKRGKKFTIPSKALAKVKELIENNYQHENRQFIAQESKEGLAILTQKFAEYRVPNKELYNRVVTMLATNNVQEVVEREKILSEEQLIALKKLSHMLSAVQEKEKELQDLSEIVKNDVPGLEQIRKEQKEVLEAALEHENKLLNKLSNNLNITNDQLVRLRRLDPQLFDSIIFLQKDITNIEKERKEIQEKILANFNLKEVSVHGTKMQMLNGHWDIVNSQDPRVQKIEAKHAANKALHKVHTLSDDQESISSANSLRASLSDRIEEELIKPQAATISPRNSISADSSGYNSDSDYETDQQSIRAVSQDSAGPVSPISEPVSNRNSVSVDYNSNNDQRDKSIERSISVDSGLGESELNSRASSDSEYEYQPLTAASSIESGLELGSQEEDVTQKQKDINSASISGALSSNLRDSDSAYGSQEDLVNTQKDPIANRVQDELRDMAQLVHRLYTYKTTQSQLVKKEIRPLVYHESALSVLEMLGGDLLRNHASNDKIHELLKEMKDNTAAAKSLMTAPEEKQKADYLLSRLEANLKGFILPHLPDTSIAFQIFKEVLLEVQGQNIPKEQYASTVIGRAQELWKKEANSRIQEVKSKRKPDHPLTDPLTEFEAIIRQGNQAEKMAKYASLLNDKQRTELSGAANEVIKSFIKELEYNKIGALSPEIKNTAKMFIFKANIPEEDLLKLQAYIDMIDMPDGLLYALFENLTIKRDKKYDEVAIALHKLRADNDPQQFVDTINRILKKANDEITSNFATNLIKAAISEVTKTRDQETFDRYKEAFNQLTPILTKLGFSNLQANSAKVVKNIATRLSENKPWPWSTPAVTLPLNILEKLSVKLSELCGEAQVSDPLTNKIMDNLNAKKLSISSDLEGKMSNAENISKDINNKGQVLKEHNQASNVLETIVNAIAAGDNKISTPHPLHREVIPIKEKIEGKISLVETGSSINSSRSPTKPCPGKEQSNNLSEKKQGMGMK